MTLLSDISAFSIGYKVFFASMDNLGGNSVKTIKRVVSTVAPLTLVSLLLTSCAPSLKASDIELSLSAGDYGYALTGDSIPFITSVTLKTDGKPKYNLALEKKSESNEWQQVALLEDVEGEQDSEIPVSVKDAGDFSYRVTFLSGKESVLSSSPIKVTVKNLKDEVRRFYYDERIACEEGASACLDRTLKQQYPGLFKLSDSYKRSLREDWSVSTTSPDLDTLEPDPTWLVPVRQCQKELGLINLDVSKPLPGRTFIVRRGESDVHVTYLNGNIHNYYAFC